jgi:hypothetical protein
MNWSQVLADLWPHVRQKHAWPELPVPQMGHIEAPVAMQMRDKHITLNTATCDELAESMPPEAVIEALLDHGVSHYTRCPWDLATYLQLYATAKAALGRKTLARLATDSFIDVVANTACVKDMPTPLPDVYRHLGGGALQGALTALYTQIWGMQLHGSGDPALVRRLARIPYLDRQQWPQSLRRFVQLLRPLLEAEARGRPQAPALGHHSLESYSQAEAALGLQAFAQQVDNIQQFSEVVQDFAQEFAALGYGTDGGTGVGPQVDAEALYYMQLAQTYHLPVRGVPLERSGVLEPYSHAPWEASQPVQDLDIWTSFGKLLPGLSQVWKRRQGLVYGQREGTPDCLLVLDSSGSMPNPRTQLSEAVLGAACAAEAYLRHEARVAVYNFSDALIGGKTVLPFTRDRQAIYQALCVYHGGGTSLRLRDLQELRVSVPHATPDFLFITDMQLTNLDDVITYLTSVNGRVTVIHIGENSATERFRTATQTQPCLQIFTVRERQDIPRIVLGQVRQYFSGLHGQH